MSLFGLNIVGLKANDFNDLVNVRRIAIVDTSIERLPAGLFAGLPNLERLSIRRSLIENIPAGMFDGLDNLPSLELTENRIKTFDADAFRGMDGLNFLSLNGNNFTTLPADLFRGLSNLQDLRLNNNPITSLPEGIFDPLMGLESLSMYGTELETLPEDTFPTRLDFRQVLLAPNAQLTELPDRMFANGTTVRSFSLWETSITSLPRNVIDVLNSSVSMLDLPPKLSGWPDGLVLPDTLVRLQVEGNASFSSLPDSVLTGSLPKSLRVLRISNLKLSDQHFRAIGTHRPVNIYSNDSRLRWIEIRFRNTGINGARITRLINDFCNNDPLCPEWTDNGPRTLRLSYEDFSDWLDPELGVSVLNAQKQAVARMNIRYLQFYGNVFSKEQVANLLNSMPKNTLDFLNIEDVDLDGLSMDSSTLNLSEFTRLRNLWLNNNNLGDTTAHIIMNSLPDSIRDLHLRSNNITNLPIIRNYPRIFGIDLSGNPIRTITPGALDNLDGLSRLRMSDTDLETLPSTLLASNSSIIWLHLENGVLNSLPNDLIDNISALRYLYLDGNALSDIPGDLLPDGIKSGLATLGLSRNDFESLPDELFAGATSLTRLDLSENQLTTLPNNFLEDNLALEFLDVSCNAVEFRPEQFTHLKRLRELVLVKECESSEEQEESSEEETVEEDTPDSPTRPATILRIEPDIRSVMLRPREVALLEVDVYGMQNILDNSLAEQEIDGVKPNFVWSEDNNEGSFSAIPGETRINLRQVMYTGPDDIGPYRVTVNIPHSAGCLGARKGETEEEALARCTATFGIKVLRPPRELEETAPPVNPKGEIPAILTDSGGTAYAVFTPVDGGMFIDDRISFKAGPDAVPDGEFIGVQVSQERAASNVGATHQRYTLIGMNYIIRAVDPSGNQFSEYRLDEPATACIPLPYSGRSNVNDLVIVATSALESLTILSSQVKIAEDGIQICAAISALPSTIAVGVQGAPPELLTPVPEVVPLAPETGGRAASISLVLVALAFGFTIVVLSLRRLLRHPHAARHPTPRERR